MAIPQSDYGCNHARHTAHTLDDISLVLHHDAKSYARHLKHEYKLRVQQEYFQMKDYHLTARLCEGGMGALLIAAFVFSYFARKRYNTVRTPASSMQPAAQYAAGSAKPL